MVSDSEVSDEGAGGLHGAVQNGLKELVRIERGEHLPSDGLEPGELLHLPLQGLVRGGVGARIGDGDGRLCNKCLEDFELFRLQLGWLGEEYGGHPDGPRRRRKRDVNDPVNPVGLQFLDPLRRGLHLAHLGVNYRTMEMIRLRQFSILEWEGHPLLAQGLRQRGGLDQFQPLSVLTREVDGRLVTPHHPAEGLGHQLQSLLRIQTGAHLRRDLTEGGERLGAPACLLVQERVLDGNGGLTGQCQENRPVVLREPVARGKVEDPNTSKDS